MLDPIVKAFEAEVRKVQLNEPRIPYMSNVSGTWITGREATNPAYWARHANHTARFSDALHELWQFENPILLEAGPGRTLGVLAMQHPDRQHAGVPIAVSSLRHHYENQSDVEFLWHAIGKLWVSGTAINWDNAHIGDRRRRVALPTYPFEKKNHWIEPTSDSARKAQEREGESEKAGIDNWFYVPTWERTPFPREIAGESQPEDAYWLIVADQYGGGACIRSRLQAMGQPVGFVRFGKAFVSGDDGAFELNPADPDHYVTLFREIKERFVGTLNIIHLGCLTTDSEPAECITSNRNEDFGFFSLLYIAQAIGELSISIPVRIGVISNRIHEVTGEESLDPRMATALGPTGVIPKEFPNVSSFNLDLPDSRVAEQLPDVVIGGILSEFTVTNQCDVLAYRGRHRWERKYEPVNLPESSVTNDGKGLGAKRLRERGIYLITGGTGGLGLAFARYLARTCQARVVLTKKTPFPEKSKWTELAQTKAAPDAIIKIVHELLEIERLGGEVEVIVADASDQVQMRRVVSETLKRFNSINGVIHAAGILRSGLIQAKTREVAESVLSPKVDGTRVLFDLLKGLDLDFLVLFSSLSSVTLPYAHCDYSAANCFMDAFAAYANSKTKFRTLSISWPVWKEVGVVAELQTFLGAEALKEQALESAMLTKDGLDAFARMLSSELHHTIVSPEDLASLIERSRVPFNPTMYQLPMQIGTRAPGQDRSQGDRGDQPTGVVEAALVEIWDSVFGFENIGIHENFSQLGGHSLLAMQITAKIRSSYQISLTLREFFEAPTIAQLSAIIHSKILVEVESLTDDQARQLLSKI